MPNLTSLIEWRRWEPGLGGNRDLPQAQRFYFELAVGLTKLQMQALDVELSKGVPDVAARIAEIEAVAALEPPPEDLPARVEDLMRKVDIAKADRLSELLSPYVRLGAEPLTLDGAPVKSLADYLHAVVPQRGEYHSTELLRALRHLNTYEGTRELFSERPPGGFSSTAGASGARNNSQTAGR